MKRTNIDPRIASVAATFYEPTYQRLRQWHQGATLNLLCFLHPTNKATKQLLDECGATPGRQFRAKCFAEIWELPNDVLLAGRFGNEPCELDQRLSETLGCHDGKYSAATGLLQWGDHREPAEHRRRVESRLLNEASHKRMR